MVVLIPFITDYEELLPNIVPFLLIRCMSDRDSISDMKRLFNIREALLLFDFEVQSHCLYHFSENLGCSKFQMKLKFVHF